MCRRWSMKISPVSTRCLPTPARSTNRVDASHLDHHVVLLHPHRKGLGRVGPFHQLGARLDRGLELPDLEVVGIAPGLAGADVEFPAMPGAAHEFALAGDAVGAGTARSHEADHPALAHRPAAAPLALARRPAGVRAAVGKREECAVDVEHADLTALDGDELLFARLDLARGGDDVTAHCKITVGTAPWRSRGKSARAGFRSG